MRVFSGIRITSSITENLKELLFALQEYKDKIKIVPSENLHITLKFLGNITSDMYLQFSKILRSLISDFSPFTVEIKGIGFFPNIKRARVIWAGTQEGISLEKLYRAAENAAQKINIPPEKFFHGHITVGRIKTTLNPDVLNTLEKNFQNRIWGKMIVDRLTIFESVLHPDGPKYKELGNIILGGIKNEQGKSFINGN